MLLILSLNRFSLLALSDLDGFSISMHGPYGSGGHVGMDTRGRTDVNACVGPSKGVQRMGPLPVVADVWGATRSISWRHSAHVGVACEAAQKAGGL